MVTSQPDHSDRLGMFAKYWQAGSVKTRLARSIGADRAAALQRVFIGTLLARFQTAPCARAVIFTPADREVEFAAITGSRWSLAPQSAGDLGERMEAFFRSSLVQGFHRIVLIGSDSPTLPTDRITEALAALETAPVVLGPSADGGFYLVGAAGLIPPIFAGVEWSTGRVWEQVIGKLAAAGIPVAQLPPWYDVDDVEGLRRLAAELADGMAGDWTEEERAAYRILGETVRSALGTSN